MTLRYFEGSKGHEMISVGVGAYGLFCIIGLWITESISHGVFGGLDDLQGVLLVRESGVQPKNPPKGLQQKLSAPLFCRHKGKAELCASLSGSQN